MSRKDDHIGPQRVEDVRRKLMSKIQTNVMQERNRVLAERRSRGWEPDENSPLIGGSRRDTEDYSDAVSFDNMSQHNLPFMVRKFTTYKFRDTLPIIFKHFVPFYNIIIANSFPYLIGTRSSTTCQLLPDTCSYLKTGQID